jgi:hypothetical protein
MARPRAADDFAAIRARMEELRGERARPVATTRSSHQIKPTFTRVGGAPSRPLNRSSGSFPTVGDYAVGKIMHWLNVGNARVTFKALHAGRR